MLPLGLQDLNYFLNEPSEKKFAGPLFTPWHFPRLLFAMVICAALSPNKKFVKLNPSECIQQSGH